MLLIKFSRCCHLSYTNKWHGRLCCILVPDYQSTWGLRHCHRRPRSSSWLRHRRPQKEDAGIDTREKEGEEPHLCSELPCRCWGRSSGGMQSAHRYQLLGIRTRTAKLLSRDVLCIRTKLNRKSVTSDDCQCASDTVASDGDFCVGIFVSQFLDFISSFSGDGVVGIEKCLIDCAMTATEGTLVVNNF